MSEALRFFLAMRWSQFSSPRGQPHSLGAAQFLAMWSFPIWLLILSSHQGESLAWQDRVLYNVTKTCKWHLITFNIFYWLEAITGLTCTQGEGTTQRYEHQDKGLTEGPLRSVHYIGWYEEREEQINKGVCREWTVFYIAVMDGRIKEKEFETG